MKNIFKLLVLAAAIIGLTACGTLQLNELITGTKCATRAECIRDLDLNNPEHPDLVFLVEPYLMTMDEMGEVPAETSTYNSPVLHADVELCIAKALREELRNSKIVFDVSEAGNQYIDIKPTLAHQHVVFPLQGYFQIDYKLNGNAYTARTESKMYWSKTDGVEEGYPLACRIVAEQVRQRLYNDKYKIQH